jgi:hypothetical protein
MFPRTGRAHAAAGLLLAGLLGSCATAPEPAARSAAAQRDFERLTAGKVPGTPLSCVPGINTSDLTIIDGRTVAYRLGAKTTYIVHLSQGCGGLASGYALVTERFGGEGPCRGDAARVLDTTSRMAVGSCMVTEVVPYVRPG